MTVTRPAPTERWLEPTAFQELQRKLVARLGARYRTRFDRSEREELANHTAVIVWQRLQENEPIENIDAYATRVVDHLARRAIRRDLHTRKAGPAIETAEGQYAADQTQPADSEDATLLGHTLQRNRSRQALALLHGLRHIYPRDVEIFAAQIVQGLSPDEICQRIGVGERQRRKAVCRVTRWIAAATQLIEEADLNEHEILALAYHRLDAGAPHQKPLATYHQQAVAERVLARSDGPQLLAEVTKALRNGAYLPLPLSATEPQTPLRRFAQLPDTLAVAKQQLTEAFHRDQTDDRERRDPVRPARAGRAPGRRHRRRARRLRRIDRRMRRPRNPPQPPRPTPREDTPKPRGQRPRKAPRPTPTPPPTGRDPGHDRGRARPTDRPSTRRQAPSSALPARRHPQRPPHEQQHRHWHRRRLRRRQRRRIRRRRWRSRPRRRRQRIPRRLGQWRRRPAEQRRWGRGRISCPVNL